MMEIHLHPSGEAEQEKKQGGIDQNYANTFFVVRFHQTAIRNCIRDFALKFKRCYLPGWFQTGRAIVAFNVQSELAEQGKIDIDLWIFCGEKSVAEENGIRATKKAESLAFA